MSILLAESCHAEDVARGRHLRAGVLRTGRRRSDDDDAALEVALRLKALADPARVKIDVAAVQLVRPARRTAATSPPCSD